MNKAEDVGMADAHHSHIGATAYSTLLYDVGYLIDDVHERYGTRCCSMFGTNRRTVRPYHFVGHAGTAASLVDGGCDFCMVHDAGERIRNLKDETSSELSIDATCVYETGSVGQEFALQHYRGHGSNEFLMLRLSRLSLGDVIDHSIDNVGPFFKGAALAIGHGITLLCNLLCVIAKCSFGRGVDKCAHYLKSDFGVMLIS